ncbi:integrase core domain-containing protein [Nonomuraea rubra]
MGTRSSPPPSTPSSPAKASPWPRSPPRSPNCNPHAERFIRSVREECTDRILLFDRGHGERILHSYARHFNQHRPHQGRQQLAPLDNPEIALLPAARIKRRKAVAGLINERFSSSCRLRNAVILQDGDGLAQVAGLGRAAP